MGAMTDKARKARDKARALARKARDNARTKASSAMHRRSEKPDRYWSALFPGPAHAPGWRPERPWERFGPAERRYEVMSKDGRTVLTSWQGRTSSGRDGFRQAVAKAERQRTGRGGR